MYQPSPVTLRASNQPGMSYPKNLVNFITSTTQSQDSAYPVNLKYPNRWLRSVGVYVAAWVTVLLFGLRLPEVLQVQGVDKIGEGRQTLKLLFLHLAWLFRILGGPFRHNGLARLRI